MERNFSPSSAPRSANVSLITLTTSPSRISYRKLPARPALMTRSYFLEESSDLKLFAVFRAQVCKCLTDYVDDIAEQDLVPEATGEASIDDQVILFGRKFRSETFRRLPRPGLQMSH